MGTTANNKIETPQGPRLSADRCRGSASRRRRQPPRTTTLRPSNRCCRASAPSPAARCRASGTRSTRSRSPARRRPCTASYSSLKSSTAGEAVVRSSDSRAVSSASGSAAITFAPRLTSSAISLSAGASRTSSVFGLKARPQIAITLPRDAAQVFLHVAEQHLRRAVVGAHGGLARPPSARPALCRC